jgi:hypothetical protein
MLIHRQNSYAASGDPVAAKSRAVETVNKVKSLPVQWQILDLQVSLFKIILDNSNRIIASQ